MKVYTCNDFKGHWPVGTSAVIMATDKEDAIDLLEATLTDMGLPQSVKPEQLIELESDRAIVRILQDGDY